MIILMQNQQSCNIQPGDKNLKIFTIMLASFSLNIIKYFDKPYNQKFTLMYVDLYFKVIMFGCH